MINCTFFPYSFETLISPSLQNDLLPGRYTELHPVSAEDGVWLAPTSCDRGVACVTSCCVCLLAPGVLFGAAHPGE